MYKKLIATTTALVTITGLAAQNSAEAEFQKQGKSTTTASNEVNNQQASPRTFTEVSKNNYISKNAARDKALTHAQVNLKDAKIEEVDLGTDNDKEVYEVEFKAKGYSFEYDIDPVTGQVLNVEKEHIGDQKSKTSLTNDDNQTIIQADEQSETALITKDEARDKALQDAGVNLQDANVEEVELSQDDGQEHYDVEFKANGTDYEYDIDPSTGQVLNVEKDETDDKQVALSTPALTINVTEADDVHDDQDDQDDQDDKAETSPVEAGQAKQASEKQAGLTLNEAKDIAVRDSGFSVNSVSFDDTENDDDYYEIEFKANGLSFEYKIGKNDGKIIEREVDFAQDNGLKNKPIEGQNASKQTSDNNRISQEAARDAALKHAGVKLEDAEIEEVDLDADNTFEVEFKAHGFEYEYEINALTGQILDVEIDLDDNASKKKHVSNQNIITRDEARDVALAHAGLKLADVQMDEVDLDFEDGRYIYEVEFRANGFEYEYEIDARDKSILDIDKDADDDSEKSDKEAQKSQFIMSREAARDIALAHAGLKLEDVQIKEIDLDEDDGFYEYEIEFTANGFEYEYEIDAVSGRILDVEKEEDDDAQEVSQTAVIDLNDVAKAASEVSDDDSDDQDDDYDDLDDDQDDQDDDSADDQDDLDDGEDDHDDGSDDDQDDTDDDQDDVQAEAETASSQTATAVKENYISREAARDAALAHAGVSIDSASIEEVEFDTDDGLASYEIEFKANGFEFEYDVNAIDGSIVNFEKDGDDDQVQAAPAAPVQASTETKASEAPQAQTEEVKPAAQAPVKISAQEALQIAINRAGVSGENEVEFDDGYWEVEIESGNQEFEVLIDVFGNIVSFDVEYDD